MVVGILDGVVELLLVDPGDLLDEVVSDTLCLCFLSNALLSFRQLSGEKFFFSLLCA